MRLKPIDWKDITPEISQATMGMGYVALVEGKDSQWDWTVYASGIKVMWGTQPSLKRAKESCEDVFLSRVQEIVEGTPFCEHCYKCKPIPTSAHTSAVIHGDWASIGISYPLGFGTASLSFPIKYCPVCGRDLLGE